MDKQNIAPVGEFLIYETTDGKSKVQCRFVDETLWLTQALMADLFQVKIPTINEHLKHIYAEGEVETEQTIRKFLIVRTEGTKQVKRPIDHYNLEAILAVGYRVRSSRGVQFRRWASERLQEYLVKGFTMDDERLKNPAVESNAVPDYFDELLERIRDIRASERRMYLRVRDLFTLAADYQPNLKTTTRFFQTMQNKLHFAATGLTAPEIIHHRVDHSKTNMGLTTFKGKAPLKHEITTAKNYLAEDEIAGLNRIVSMWLDYAEDQASRRKQVFLQDWEVKLNQFLEFNDRDVLMDKGRVSKKDADSKAHQEYDLFKQQQRALIEAQAEQDNLRVLEDISKRKTENQDHE